MGRSQTEASFIYRKEEENRKVYKWEVNERVRRLQKTNGENLIENFCNKD